MSVGIFSDGGKCSHVIALLHMICHFKMINMNEIPWDKTCTDLPQKWHDPRGPSIQSEPAMKLNFVKAITDVTKERQRKPVECLLYEARGPGAKEVSSDAIQAMQKDLDSRKKVPFSYTLSTSNNKMCHTKLGDVAVGSVLSYQLTDCKPKFNLTSNIQRPCSTIESDFDVPSLPVKFGSPVIDISIPLNTDQYRSIFSKLQVDMDQAKSIEVATKQQHLSKSWKEERAPRLTASKFGDILVRKATPSDAFLKRIFDSPDISHTSAASHGIKSENKAKDIYRKKMVKKFKHDVTLYDVGLVVNPAFPWLGASPDGKVLDRSYTPPLGLLEIKCPFTYKDLTPSEASLNQDFYCEMVDNKIRLKHSHKYYAQVQGQLALSGLTWCDFTTHSCWTQH